MMLSSPCETNGQLLIVLPANCCVTDVGFIKAESSFVLCRDNILVLDVFFEALNYETIEQKKAYEVAGLLGEISLCVNLISG